MRILAKVEYIGKNYCGWQKQNEQLSIEETIENVISKILNAPTKIYGSGRTDSKVNACGQYFHFDILKNNVDIDRLKYSINCLLPNDISILSLKCVDDNFHARYSAKRKIYMYQIYLGEPSVFLKDYVEIVYQSFDLDLFKKSLNLFVGQHNFKNFTSKEEDEDNFVRTIYKIDVIKDKNLIKVIINGDGFMRYMIRYIIGTSINVAIGKIDINFINDLLNKDVRNITSYKANSCGLFLMDVLY